MGVKFKFNNSLRFSFLIGLVIVTLIKGVYAFPVDYQNQSLSLSPPSSLGVGISILVLICLIGLIFSCLENRDCCGFTVPKIYWFGRTGNNPLPRSFDNPVANLGSLELSQIDARALELDPVVFEPLPTIHDLSPLSLSQEDKGVGVGSNRKEVLVVPFAADESELYAHDWFDETYHNFQRNNLEFVRQVGRGWFGEVLEAEARDIVPYARKVKVIVKRLKQDASQIEQMRFLDECRVYREANQGNVLKLLGHCIERLPFMLILEYWPQGDLKSYLISNVTRAEALSTQGILLSMAIDIAKGLEWILTSNFKHPDLAARNCQVVSEGRIVIGDYGLATRLYKDDYYWNSNVPIPIRWAAPETIHCTPNTIQTLKVTKASNVWSFAVLLWEITEFGKLPYFELCDEEVITQVLADKNYFLGQPTLPYIPCKEQLYRIMRDCWNIEPNKRPDMSTVIARLQDLKLNLGTEKRSDSDFENKWERLGRLSSSGSGDTDSPRRKKSVSFTGIENAKLVDEMEREKIRAGSEEGKSQTAISNENLAEREEEHEEQWMEEIEQGGISQKVLEKSQSAQDFMVLTHVEPSDIHGPESLMEVTDSSTKVDEEKKVDPTSASGSLSFYATCSPGVDENTLHKSKDNHSGHSSGASSSSERSMSTSSTEGWKSDFFSSNDGEGPSVVPDTPGSSDSQESQEVKQGLTIQQDQALLTPSPGIGITFQQPSSRTTPNRTGIDINLITATPSPAPENAKVNSNENGESLGTVLEATATGDRKSVFTFNEMDIGDTPPREMPPQPPLLKLISGRRHTSTPKRSESSPVPSDQESGMNGNGNENLDENVFEMEENSENGQPVFNDTLNLSPIALKKARAGIRSGELITTIVGVGASDDLGLDVFQGVTSQIEELSYNDENESDCSESVEEPVRSNGHNSYGIKKLPEYDLRPFPKSPREANGAHYLTTVTEGGSAKTGPTSSWAELSSMSKSNTNSKSSQKPPTIGSSWDVVSSAEMKKGAETNNNEEEEEKQAAASILRSEDVNCEDEAFWDQQFKSFSSAAADTRCLFALSLGESEIVPSSELSPASKFIEDIEAANEELGSLVLEDLENASKSVIPRSLPPQDEDFLEPKVAFNGNGTVNDVKPPPTETEQTNVEPWTDPALVRLKAQTPSEPDEEPASGPTSADFVPSTWNQSLQPARRAIKSPLTSEQPEQKYSLKKSVSFERKKRQLVYEYPPAPQPSDSEDEGNKVKAESSPVAAPLLPSPTLPMHHLDWDLTQDELDSAPVNPIGDDSDDDSTVKSDPMDMYKLSGFDHLDTSFKIRPSQQPFEFSSPSTLGQLRHTRDKLRLDLSCSTRGEACLLDDDPHHDNNTASSKGIKTCKEDETSQIEVLDSGVGSSTNEPPSSFIPSSE